MAMSESERLRLRQEAAIQYISRSKVRDSSELTSIKQARASSTAIPTTVLTTTVVNGCAATQVIRGKGVNMEYGGILQKAQGCAVCADPDPVVNPGVTLPTCCPDVTKPPFAQQDLNGPIYVSPYKDTAGNVYFPAPIYDGAGCTYNRQTTPSG